MASLTFLCLSLPLSEAGIPVGPLWGLRSDSAGVWLCWSSGATGPASHWAEVLRELALAIWRHAPLAPARPENPPGSQVLGSGRRQPHGPLCGGGASWAPAPRLLRALTLGRCAGGAACPGVQGLCPCFHLHLVCPQRLGPGHTWAHTGTPAQHCSAPGLRWADEAPPCSPDLLIRAASHSCARCTLHNPMLRSIYQAVHQLRTAAFPKGTRPALRDGVLVCGPPVPPPCSRTLF